MTRAREKVTNRADYSLKGVFLQQQPDDKGRQYHTKDDQNDSCRTDFPVCHCGRLETLTHKSGRDAGPYRVFRTGTSAKLY